MARPGPFARLKEAMSKWTWHHVTVFFLTFFSYACFHACRKAFSNIKDTFEKSHSPVNGTIYPADIWMDEHMFSDTKNANVFLGELDTLFLLAYAIGLYISGIIGDRIDLRYLLSAGMILSALMTFLFGYLSVVLKVRNRLYFQIIYFVNGLCQSTGWPATVAVVGNWFSKSSGGLVFGFWSGNASLGNIFGSLIVASVLSYGYEYGMMLNSILLFCGGVVVFFCLIPHPKMIGLECPDGDEGGENTLQPPEVTTTGTREDSTTTTTSNQTSSENEQINQEISMPEVVTKVENKRGISFFQAWLIPGVLPYSLSYACLKMVNYAFFFWLPTYLTQGVHWSDKKSDELSNFYDIGGITGGIVAGVITDLMGARSPIVSLMLLLSMGSLYLYSNIGGQYTANVAVMILTGFLLGGPANTISSAITADLGKHEKIQGNAEALATVTGIIDGTGSIGAAIGQYLVGYIGKVGGKAQGWHYVFYFLIVMTALSFLCVLPMLIGELKTMCRSRPANYDVLDDEEVNT